MAERHVPSERLSAHLDGEVPATEARSITDHLDGCPRCTDALEELAEARSALQLLPSLEAPVLYSGRPARQARRRRQRRRLALLASLAVLTPAAVLGGGYLAGGTAGEVTPNTELFLVEHLGRTGGSGLPAPVAGHGW